MSDRIQGAYVSRGGYKLAHALTAFSLKVTGLRALDVGASTGGFTDCLLRGGAAEVSALDVAYGQLAWTLRCDQRVNVIERTNIRQADLSSIGAPFDLVVADLAFISLAKVLPQLAKAAGASGDLLLLVKPQFEARRDEVEPGGLVTDPSVHSTVLTRLAELVPDYGLQVLDWTHSPIKGPKGNIEFWLHAAACGDRACVTIEEVVERAHEGLPSPEKL